MGIYYPDKNALEGRRHLMGFEFGYSPEFTVRHPEATGPKKVTRGWRAIIVMLVKRGYIELEAACRVFAVARGRDSAYWQRDLDGG
jgi:hypothetical protein